MQGQNDQTLLLRLMWRSLGRTGVMMFVLVSSGFSVLHFEISNLGLFEYNRLGK